MIFFYRNVYVCIISLKRHSLVGSCTGRTMRFAYFLRALFLRGCLHDTSTRIILAGESSRMILVPEGEHKCLCEQNEVIIQQVG